MRLIYECRESFGMFIENLKCVALAVPEIDWSFGWDCNLGEEEVIGGRGWSHSKERW